MTDQHYGAHADKHAWLGIDPGVTTGWALVTDDGKVAGSGNLPENQVKQTLDTLIRAAHGEGYALTAVIERVPRAGGAGRLAHRLDFVVGEVNEVVRETYDLPTVDVMPGAWKTSRVARMMKRPRSRDQKVTQHQWDAIRMTCYVIDREERKTHFREAADGR